MIVLVGGSRTVPSGSVPLLIVVFTFFCCEFLVSDLPFVYADVPTSNNRNFQSANLGISVSYILGSYLPSVTSHFEINLSEPSVGFTLLVDACFPACNLLVLLVCHSSLIIMTI